MIFAKRILVAMVSLVLVIVLPVSVYAVDEETLFFYGLNNIFFFNPDSGCKMGGGNNFNYSGASIFSSAELEAIEANRPFYEKSAKAYNIPWQVLAVIHSLEYNSLRSNPEDGQGVYQLYSYTRKENSTELDPDKAFLPAGEIDDEEFQRQTDIAAEFIANKASGLNLGTDAGVKRLFFLYNGAADAYVKQAKALGFSDEEAKNGEGSPYVMNRFDKERDPSVEPTKSNDTWGQIKEDRKGMIYPANLHFGAFVMYAALGGSTRLCSSSSGGLVSGGMTLAEAQEFMKYYISKAIEYQDVHENVFLDGATLYYLDGACFGALTNCVAFSRWFVARYTSLGDPVTNHGIYLASTLANAYGLEYVAGVPQVYSVFSTTGYTSAGHTGIILGIDEEAGTVVYGEAACKGGIAGIKANQAPLSQFTSNNYKYAYLQPVLTGL